ncbi:TIGR03545 family protein [candidate division KSB1 bacterium]|nr:TIGR03545 family protein [candidate division KSB1 bacterium]
MRKKGIIYLLVIALIIAAIAFFTRDRYLERGLELAIQAIAGAKVEIDNFNFSLFKTEGSWNRIQIADKNNPWKNIIETGRASFDLEARALFWRRVIIREMALENVRNGTARITDGSLPKKIVPEPATDEPAFTERVKTALEKQLGDVPIFDLSGLGKKLKIDSLIDVQSLASVQAYNKLETVADSTFKFWRAQVDTQTYITRVKVLEDKIKSLKLENIDNIKDVVKIVDLIKKVDDINKEIKALKGDVEGKYDGLTQTFTDIQSQLKLAQNSFKEDLDRAKQLAKLKDLDVKDVSMLLFGNTAVQKVNQLLDYVAMVRKYLPVVQKLKGTPKVEQPPRFKGQDIHFSFHYRYPRFLIRQAKLSAATAAGDTSKAYFLNGIITGITNQPPVYGNPTKFNLDLMRISGNKYQISGSLDHREEIAKDSLWLRADDFGLGKLNLKGGKYFPQAISAQQGAIALSGFFIGNDIDLKLRLDAAPVKFAYETETADRIGKIVRDVLGGLNQLNLKAELKNVGSDYKLNLNSNVDNVLANQVKLTIAQNLRDAQQQVENFVRAEVDKRRLQVEAIVEKNRQTIYSGVDRAKQRVQAQFDEIEKRKKELEARKKKLEEDAKNKLKGIFKTP